MSAWAARYEELALTGLRSREVADRIALHLGRFGEYLSATYGHDRLATVVRRDVVGWRDMLVSSGLGPSTVNNHLASLAGFCGWVAARAHARRGQRSGSAPLPRSGRRLDASVA